MKKILALLTVVALILQLVPAIALADSDDAIKAVQSLTEQQKAFLMEKIWDFVIVKIAEDASIGVDISVNEIYDDMVAEIESDDDLKAIWDTIISDDPSQDEDGKLSTNTVKQVIQKLVNNKDIIISYYELYISLFNEEPQKTFIKEILGLPPAAGEGQVYARLQTLVAVPIIRYNTSTGQFEAVAGASALISQKINDELGINQALVDALLGTVGGKSLSERIDEFVEGINRNMAVYNVDYQDIIDMLSLFGLYRAPGSGGGGGGAGGGGGGSAGEETPSISEIIGELEDLCESMADSAAENIGEIASNIAAALLDAAGIIDGMEDAEEAIEQAGAVISSLAGVMEKLEENYALEKQVVKSIMQVVGKVLDKVGTVNVASTTAGGKATASIGADYVSQLSSKMDEIIETVGKLNDELAGANMGIRAEALLKLQVTVDAAAAGEASVQLAGNLFETAAEKGIDKIVIDAGIASITVSPDAIPASGGEFVTLSVRKAKKAELPASVQAAVGESQVYDFSAFIGDSAVSSFNKPIEVSLPYTLKEGEDPEKITVFYINDEGKLVNVTGVYDASSKTVRFTTTHFSKYVARENKVSFSDMAGYAWAKDYVEAMAAKGVIQGIGEGKFNPAGNVTRAEFAAMLVRAFKLMDETAELSFKDVDADAWYRNAVASACKAGVVKGRSAEEFAPNDSITRQEMATMLANTLREVLGKAPLGNTDKFLAKFKDRALVASYAIGPAALVSRYSIMQGTPEGNFNPTGTATRAEAAAVVYRLFYVE